MNFPSIFTGWGLGNRATSSAKRFWTGMRLSKEAKEIVALAENVDAQLKARQLHDEQDHEWLICLLAERTLLSVGAEEETANLVPLYQPLRAMIHSLANTEGYFSLHRTLYSSLPPERSELWAIEDQLKRVSRIVDNFDKVAETLVTWFAATIAPLVEQVPALLQPHAPDGEDISFDTKLADILNNADEIIEAVVQLPFAEELEHFDLALATCHQIETNLHAASGGSVLDELVGVSARRTVKSPTKSGATTNKELITTYLAGTPFGLLFEATVPITIPQQTRFEHQHIVAGTGHGKTQLLQNLILHDLDQVAAGKVSIVVIDSQSDLIDNIAGLEMFQPGQPLADRLCVIDPRDVEWPVALNLFDVGLDRLEGYSQLERERLTNGILELYDFVLGSLLDAGMTQKQAVIFRYITRLLIRIPNATIHTLRELLEDGGYDKYEDFINQLEGSAKAFFTEEFRSSEFKATKKQVLRRLYGILENQSFERMFSHPKSKLDLFAEMNAGKVILINTAKDLLKENGTEILGRFFIAMIAQAAQERAVLPKSERLPTFVYIDEAQDYFDRNIGIILSQTRKYNVGMVLAHQFLGQLSSSLQEAIFANTSIKFAGGVSSKDARTLAADFHAEPSSIESQAKLSFSTFIKGTTKKAASIAIDYGVLEALPRLSEEDLEVQREAMREKYAVHYTEAQEAAQRSASDPDAYDEPPDETGEAWWDEDEEDPNEPRPWRKWQRKNKSDD